MSSCSSCSAFGLGLYPSAQVYPPVDAPLGYVGRRCRMWNRRDAELLPIWMTLSSVRVGAVAGILVAALDSLTGNCSGRHPERLNFYPSVQLYPPLEASLLPAGCGCWVWRRRDVEQLPAWWARTGFRGGIGAGTSGTEGDTPLGSRSSRSSSWVYFYPSVQVYPPSDAPLLFARRGCWTWNRRDVESLPSWLDGLPGCTGTCAEIADSDFGLPTGGCSPRPSERIDFYPSVQLYPPLEASLRSAGCGCWARKRRDVEQLPVWRACTPTSRVTGPSNMDASSMSPLGNRSGVPAVPHCGGWTLSSSEDKHLPACSLRPSAVSDLLVDSQGVAVALVTSMYEWGVPASDAGFGPPFSAAAARGPPSGTTLTLPCRCAGLSMRPCRAAVVWFGFGVMRYR